MKSLRTFFIHSLDLERFPYPVDCPFNTSRAGRVRKIVDSMGLLDGPGRKEIPPSLPKRMELKKIHTARYLHALKNADSGKFDPEALNMGIGSPDCPIFKGMYGYSALTCSATLTGARLILDGDADIAFNPSGGLHHAGSERASGFCYLNDVAVGCSVLAQAGKKVLYLDVDVHHGDGVQNAFYTRSDVMTMSFHQSGKTLFPGTGFEDEIGSGDGKGYCVNVPLPIGTYDEIYLKAFKNIAVPLIAAFAPDVIVLQLGADALADDPLAHLYLTNNAYAEIIKHLMSLNKPILATGGGGYNIDNTVRAWALAWTVFTDSDRASELKDENLKIPPQQHQAVVDSVKITIDKIKSKLFTLHNLC